MPRRTGHRRRSGLRGDGHGAPDDGIGGGHGDGGGGNGDGDCDDGDGDHEDRCGDVGSGDAAGSTGGCGGTLEDTVSTSALTIWAAVVAGAAILVLVVTDHRQPVRRRAPVPREDGRAPRSRRPDRVQELGFRPTRLARRPGPVARVKAVVGAGVLGAMVGGLLALVVAVMVIGLAVLLERAVT